MSTEQHRHQVAEASQEESLAGLIIRNLRIEALESPMNLDFLDSLKFLGLPVGIQLWSAPSPPIFARALRQNGGRPTPLLSISQPQEAGPGEAPRAL